MSRRKTVCVAMSGGVDSAVVAALLKRRGHDVIGVTMQIWQESQRDPRHSGCCSLGAVEDARRVSRLLDIPHYVVNYQESFRKAVIEEFLDEYTNGRTPNPCVTCNKKVKFQALLAQSAELGCDVLATGHYARVRRSHAGPVLMQARCQSKDQSYVLYMLNAEQLDRVWFPLGELDDKAETRAIARQLGLPVADKPDSQEVCFVSEAGGYAEFVRKHRPGASAPGEVVDTVGRRLAAHSGVAGFTIGQRRGLNVAAGKPLYVVKLDPRNRQVVVGSQDDLLAHEVRLLEPHVSPTVIGRRSIRVKAMVRYNMEPQPAMLDLADEPTIRFDKPVRAIAPGQIAVAYRGKTVVAGGTIR